VPGQTSKKIETPAICVKDDWSEELPVLEAEMDLLETHMLDIITAMVQHS
jgi:hypothetical protein